MSLWTFLAIAAIWAFPTACTVTGHVSPFGLFIIGLVALCATVCVVGR